MPHISLEYTENILTIIKSDFFDQLFGIIIKAADVKLENCKSRSIKIKDFYTGSKNKDEGFVHLKIKILEGRTKKVKNQIAQKTLEILKLYFNNSIDHYIQYSIEIQEMKTDNYLTSNILK